MARALRVVRLFLSHTLRSRRCVVGSRPHSPLDTVFSGIVFQSASAPGLLVGATIALQICCYLRSETLSLSHITTHWRTPAVITWALAR